jgi:CcmD family protein
MTPLYTVMIVILFIWSGIFLFMLRLDRQMRMLRESIKKMNRNGVNRQ